MSSDIREIRSNVFMSMGDGLKHGFIYSLEKGVRTDTVEISFDFDRIFTLKQIHSNKVVVFDDGCLSDSIFEADAMVTPLKGVCLAIYTADCVPVLMCAPKKGVIGAVHAGWRGTCSRIVVNALRTFVDTFFVDTKEVVAVIGPSIGRCCYDVGEDVVSRFKERFYDHNKFVFLKENRWYVDLIEANVLQLKECGVEKIDVLNLCTYCNETFPSYRREGAGVGRILSYIGFV